MAPKLVTEQTPEEAKLAAERDGFLKLHAAKMRDLKLTPVPDEAVDDFIYDSARRSANDAAIAEVLYIAEKLHTRFPEAQGKAFATMATCLLAERISREGPRSRGGR